MGFRADLIIEDQVIVEIKSVDAVAPVHKKQLLTHLRPHQGRHHPHREWTSGLISPKDVLPYLARNRSETEQGYKSVCGGAALCHTGFGTGGGIPPCLGFAHRYNKASGRSVPLLRPDIARADCAQLPQRPGSGGS